MDDFMQGVPFMGLLTKKEKYNPLIVSFCNRTNSVRFLKNGFVYSPQNKKVFLCALRASVVSLQPLILLFNNFHLDIM